MLSGYQGLLGADSFEYIVAYKYKRRMAALDFKIATSVTVSDGTGLDFGRKGQLRHNIIGKGQLRHNIICIFAYPDALERRDLYDSDDASRKFSYFLLQLPDTSV